MPRIRTIAAVKAANPASWVTLDGLREQREAVHPLAFLRFHANVWTGGQCPFITADEWDRCAAQPDIPAAADVVLGVDASIRHDSTAICVVRRDGDTYHAQWRVWTPAHGDEISLGEVEQFIRDLADHFTVQAVVYDRHYAWHMAQRLDEEGLPMIEWPYVRMPSATRTLHEIVSHGRLRHGGDDIARRHALAAEVKERETGLIISKRASREQIDALISLAMAVEIAASLEPPRRSVYETVYRPDEVVGADRIPARGRHHRQPRGEACTRRSTPMRAARDDPGERGAGRRDRSGTGQWLEPPAHGWSAVRRAGCHSRNDCAEAKSAVALGTWGRTSRLAQKGARAGREVMGDAAPGGLRAALLVHQGSLQGPNQDAIAGVAGCR